MLSIQAIKLLVVKRGPLLITSRSALSRRAVAPEQVLGSVKIACTSCVQQYRHQYSFMCSCVHTYPYEHRGRKMLTTHRIGPIKASTCMYRADHSE